MNKNSILIILTFFLLSCLNDDSLGPCGDLSNQPKFYDIQDFTTKNYIYNGTDLNPYQAWNITAITTSQKINATKFVVELNAISNFTLVENNQYKSIDFSLFRSAIACSPVPPSTYENITILKITSDADFSNEYPVGSNLNKLFFVKKTWGRGVNSNYDSFMLYNKNITIDEFLLAKPPGMRAIQMILSMVPTISKTHNFKIEYTHSDGEFFEIFLKTVNFE